MGTVLIDFGSSLLEQFVKSNSDTQFDYILNELNTRTPRYHNDPHGNIYREDPKTRQLEQVEEGMK